MIHLPIFMYYHLYPDQYTMNYSHRLINRVNIFLVLLGNLVYNCFVSLLFRMVSVQKKLDKAVSCLIYFSTREWKFLDDNVLALNASLSQADKEVFPFDVRQIKWPLYIEDYVLGIRQFIFKESPSSIPKARKQLTK